MSRPLGRFCILLFALCSSLAVGQQTGAAAPVARVGNDVITGDDLQIALAGTLARIQEQVYRIKRQKLDALIDQRLLEQEAARRGVTSAALLEAEVDSKAAGVNDAEVHAFYEKNKEHIEAEEKDVAGAIRRQLAVQKLAERRKAFLDSLRAGKKIVVNLPPPEYRAPLSTDNAVSRGPADAPVTIVAFEDFQCPYCRQSHATLQQLFTQYGDKLRYVHRDFPIARLHPAAQKAHEAARCAGEQEKFWEYWDLLYAEPSKVSPADLSADAKQIGLDIRTFDACLASGRHKNAVADDIAIGKRLGVDSTPAFFVNGRLLSGAYPLEDFQRIIDEELSYARNTKMAQE